MRPVVLAMIVAPALALSANIAQLSGQVRVGVHIDIPIISGGHGVVIHRPAPPPPPRDVRVYQYSPRDYGNWREEARRWRPVTLYLFEGRYYQEPIGRARAVLAYYYRGTYFLEPRDRDWGNYRDRYLRDDDRRNDRGDSNYRDDRDGDRRTGPPDYDDQRARPRPRGPNN